MKEEISLSDWETQYFFVLVKKESYGFVFPKSKVKEFIQKLKDELVIKHFKTVKETAEQGVRDIVKIIDKLAGNELTK